MEIENTLLSSILHTINQILKFIYILTIYFKWKKNFAFSVQKKHPFNMYSLNEIEKKKRKQNIIANSHSLCLFVANFSEFIGRCRETILIDINSI